MYNLDAGSVGPYQVSHRFSGLHPSVPGGAWLLTLYKVVKCLRRKIERQASYSQTCTFYSVLSMLVKWHTKPYSAERPAKHVVAFTTIKITVPPLDVVYLLLTCHISLSVATLTACTLFTPLNSSLVASTSLQGALKDPSPSPR